MLINSIGVVVYASRTDVKAQPMDIISFAIRNNRMAEAMTMIMLKIDIALRPPIEKSSPAIIGHRGGR